MGFFAVETSRLEIEVCCTPKNTLLHKKPFCNHGSYALTKERLPTEVIGLLVIKNSALLF